MAVSPARHHSRRQSILSAGAAVALALILGLAYVKWMGPYAVDPGTEHLLWRAPGISGRLLKVDEFEYLSIAKSLTDGKGYCLTPGIPTALRIPGYPLYVAALFHFFGSSLNVALIGNAFLIALLPALTFALAVPAFGRRTAVVAAFFCALNPGLYYFGLTDAMSESLFAVLLCAGVVLWQRAQAPYAFEGWASLASYWDTAKTSLRNLPEAQFSIWFALAAGILFGLASLTRTGFLALPVFLLLMEFAVRRHSISLKKAAVLCVAFVLVLLPWGLRNRAVMGTLTFSSTNDGRTLLGSMLAAQQKRGDWHNPEFLAPEYAQIRKMPDGIERNRAETHMAIVEMKKIPLSTVPEVVEKRVLRFWVPLNRIVSDEFGRSANIAVNVFYFPAMLLAAFGLWRARRNPAMVPLWTIFVYMTLLVAISWGGTRFRYPVEPFLAVFAAHGLFELYKLSFGRPRPMRI